MQITNMSNNLKLKKVGYVFSENLLQISSKNPIIKNRSKMVHSLIESYKLLKNVEIITSKPCTYSDLRGFHAEDYCDILKKIPSNNHTKLNVTTSEEDTEEDEISIDDNLSEYGLGFDCPVWKGLYTYCLEVAGSTITACNSILDGNKLVINWFGGWHHAQRDKAAGYCYVNDIVLGILILKQKFRRILYLDLDVHYGDGVADAFESTKSVFTLSFHQYEPGFYPGSGNVDDCGFGNAKGYSVNFPYKSGISGEVFGSYYSRLVERVMNLYKPEVVIIQCGADVITGDPLGNSNLVPEDLGNYIKLVLDKNLPTLLLGGGGYNFPNTSRYWTQLTSLVVCDQSLSDDIPDKDEYFLQYSPGYELNIKPKTIKDLNDKKYLDEVLKNIENNLKNYQVEAI